VNLTVQAADDLGVALNDSFHGNRKPFQPARLGVAGSRDVATKLPAHASPCIIDSSNFAASSGRPNFRENDKKRITAA